MRTIRESPLNGYTPLETDIIALRWIPITRESPMRMRCELLLNIKTLRRIALAAESTTGRLMRLI